MSTKSGEFHPHVKRVVQDWECEISYGSFLCYNKHERQEVVFDKNKLKKLIDDLHSGDCIYPRENALTYPRCAAAPLPVPGCGA